MKVLGFNITKIKAEKEFKFTKSEVNTNITFTNVETEKIELLKDSEALKNHFKFTIEYTDGEKKEKGKNEVSFEGFLILSVSKDESKEFKKAWKKKEVPKDKMIPLYNLILKRCSIKALGLEEDLGLPAHIPMPQVKPGQQ